MNRVRRHLVASGSMLLGSALVFGFLALMNAYTKPPEAEAEREATSFDVEKKQPPKRRPRVERKRQRPQRPSDAPRAPLPDLGSALSSVDLAMPGFDGSELGALSNKMLGQVDKRMVMDEASVDRPPKPVRRVAPDEYPDSARKRGITGHVTMNLLIGVNGEVERVRVVEAVPTGIFDEVAMATIRKWRFEPASYEQQHVRAWAKQTIRFELN